jgi:hypothetical protein
MVRGTRKISWVMRHHLSGSPMAGPGGGGGHGDSPGYFRSLAPCCHRGKNLPKGFRQDHDNGLILSDHRASLIIAPPVTWGDRAGGSPGHFTKGPPKVHDAVTNETYPASGVADVPTTTKRRGKPGPLICHTTGQNHSASHSATNFYLSGKITEGKVRDGFFVNHFPSGMSDQNIAGGSHHHSVIGWKTRGYNRPVDAASVKKEAADNNGAPETSRQFLYQTLLISPNVLLFLTPELLGK